MQQSKEGWLPSGTLDSNTGTCLSECRFGMMHSGFAVSGVLFARKYLQTTFPKDAEVGYVSSLVDDFHSSVNFDTILCNADGTWDSAGTCVPDAVSHDDTKCAEISKLEEDGMYQFSDEHHAVWLAHEMSKAKSSTGEATKPI